MPGIRQVMALGSRSHHLGCPRAEEKDSRASWSLPFWGRDQRGDGAVTPSRTRSLAG